MCCCCVCCARGGSGWIGIGPAFPFEACTEGVIMFAFTGSCICIGAGAISTCPLTGWTKCV